MHVDQPLDAALRHMAQAKLNVLPVVSRTNLRNLRGVVTLNGILRAYGVTDAEEAVPEPAHSVTRRSGAFLPGLIAATLGALLLVGFLNYYYRSERAARADRYFKAGNDLVLHDRNQEAVEQFRNALSVSPDNREYRLALGLTLVKTGRLEEASVYLEEVLRRDPTNGRANLGLARIAAQQGRTADAVTCYHRAIYGSWPADQAANQVQVRFELAAFLEKAGLRTQATAELLAIIDRVPNDTAAKKRIGRLLLDYGSPRQSADVFRGLVRENNRDAEAYSGLGAAEFAEEQYVAAREAFRSALRLNPSDEATQRELALCERILELDPTVRGLGPAERYRRSAALLEGSLARWSNVFRRSASPRTLSLFGPGRTRRASRWPAIRLAGRMTMPPSPIFRWRKSCGRPARNCAARRPGSMRPRIACLPPCRGSDRLQRDAVIATMWIRRFFCQQASSCSSQTGRSLP